MRFNTQEINGSRVRLHYSVDLEYEAQGQAEFLLNVHAARTSRQQVLKEYFSVTPERPLTLAEDAATGNRIAAFDSGAGHGLERLAGDIGHDHVIDGLTVD